MKLRNSTDYADAFLRRLVAYCCRGIDLSLSPRYGNGEVRFTKTSTAHGRGRAWDRQWSSEYRVLVRINQDSSWPFTFQYRKTAPAITYADPIEFLVALTAHELWHIKQYRMKWPTNEAQNERAALEVLTAFRADRDRLVAEWSEPVPVKPERPKQSAVERRAAKAVSDLERWARKLKLAQTKIRKLKQRVRYYERVAARKQS